MGSILFVDDDTDALEMYRKAVSLGDHRAYLAANAAQASQLIEDNDLDLIFVDINLPDVSGMQLIKEITADPERLQVPIIVLSALPGEELVEEALAAGAEMFISKPVALHKLLSVIDEYQPS